MSSRKPSPVHWLQAAREAHAPRDNQVTLPLPLPRRGRTAKELSVLILEQGGDSVPCTRVEHANYLGREFQRAEMALISGGEYVQD
jgi:hypothetical protein